MASLQKAINEKCFDCGYDPFDAGTKHQQIESCLDHTCALYPFRPVTHSEKLRRKQEAYDNLSPEEKLKADKKKSLQKQRMLDMWEKKHAR